MVEHLTYPTAKCSNAATGIEREKMKLNFVFTGMNPSGKVVHTYYPKIEGCNLATGTERDNGKKFIDLGQWE
jgi:hypothetical protein